MVGSRGCSPDRDGGFILTTASGDEIYFHRNSVTDGSFDALEIGAEVRFVAQQSESAQGPQASTVTPLGKHHSAANRDHSNVICPAEQYRRTADDARERNRRRCREIVEIVGPLDDAVVLLEIQQSRATAAEVLEANVWVNANDQIGTETEHATAWRRAFAFARSWNGRGTRTRPALIDSRVQGSHCDETSPHIMTRQVVTEPIPTRRRRVARLMLTHRVSAIPVVDDEARVVGIVSDHDLLRRPPSDSPRAWWLRLFDESAACLEDIATARHLHARDVMTSPAVTVGDKTPIDVLATLMRRRRVKRVPVLQHGRLVGIVSRTDLLDALVRHGEGAGDG